MLINNYEPALSSTFHLFFRGLFVALLIYTKGTVQQEREQALYYSS